MVVVVMVAVVVAPGPILLLLFRRQSAKIPARVAVRLVGPAVIVDRLIVVPHVVVGVVRVVDANVMMFAGDPGQRRSQSCGQQQSPE